MGQNDGINVKIPNNQALAEILRDIMNRSQRDGEKNKGNFSGGGINYQDSYKTMTASLQTIIALLEAASGNKPSQQYDNQNKGNQQNQNNN